MDPAQQDPPAASDTPAQPTPPSTGGGENGDNSTINGDKPIEHPPSTQLVEEAQSAESATVQKTNAAQITNSNSDSIVEESSKDSKGESYDQVRKLGDMVEKAE